MDVKNYKEKLNKHFGPRYFIEDYESISRLLSRLREYDIEVDLIKWYDNINDYIAIYNKEEANIALDFFEEEKTNPFSPVSKCTQYDLLTSAFVETAIYRQNFDIVYMAFEAYDYDKTHCKKMDKYEFLVGILFDVGAYLNSYSLAKKLFWKYDFTKKDLAIMLEMVQNPDSYNIKTEGDINSKSQKKLSDSIKYAMRKIKK